MAAWDQVPLSAPATFFGQKDYAATMADILSSPGRTLRGIQESDRDYAAKMQQLADQKAYQTGQLDLQKQRLANDVADTGGTYGTQYYDKDAAGNLYPYIISKQGEKKYIGAGPGRTVAVKTVPLDTGTGYTPYNPQTGTPAGAVIPKFPGTAKEREALGGAIGAAKANLPSIEAAGDQITTMLDNTMNDPDLALVTGREAYLVPEALKGPAMRNAQAKVEQLKGQAFLIAYERLRGGGAITETEGAAASAALTRLQEQKVDDPHYLETLQDFKREVQALVDLARRKAAMTIPGEEGAAPAPPPPPAAPGGGNDPLGIR